MDGNGFCLEIFFGLSEKHMADKQKRSDLVYCRIGLFGFVLQEREWKSCWTIFGEACKIKRIGIEKRERHVHPSYRI